MSTICIAKKGREVRHINTDILHTLSLRESGSQLLVLSFIHPNYPGYLLCKKTFQLPPPVTTTDVLRDHIPITPSRDYNTNCDVNKPRHIRYIYICKSMLPSLEFLEMFKADIFEALFFYVTQRYTVYTNPLT